MPDEGDSQAELTKCQHRLSQHYKCKDEKKKWQKKSTSRRPTKGIQIKTGEQMAVFFQRHFNSMANASQLHFTRNYIDVWITYRRLPIRIGQN